MCCLVKSLIHSRLKGKYKISYEHVQCSVFTVVNQLTMGSGILNECGMNEIENETQEYFRSILRPLWYCG